MNHNVTQGVRGPLARIGARRRYRRPVQLRPDPADQLAGHPGAFLTQGLAPGAGPDSRSGSRARSRANQPLTGEAGNR